ncbi:MAG: glycoside-pentoside-hexuronide (GPH):cation symporter [Pseudoflavonifractor sp.]
MNTEKNEKIVPLKIKLGYTIGSIGDSTVYNIVISFLSFFLTTVAGISPAVAGGIISIAIAWDAITDPMLGLMVDHSRSRHGKRRPFIIGSLVPLCASIVFLFLNVNLPQTAKNLYYLIVVLVFWTAYTAFNIPYYSLGSVITNDDDERTKISGWRETMGFIGIFCGTSVPTFLVGKFLEANLSDTQAWLYAAIVAALIAFVAIFTMWRTTRGREPQNEQIIANAEKQSLKQTLKGMLGLMTMRSYIVIILSALFCNVYMTLFNSDMLYYTSFVMGISEAQASILFTVMSICSIAMIPFITRAAIHSDKRNVYVGCMGFSGIIMVLAKFTGIPGTAFAIAYVIAVSVGTSAYWLFIFNFLYDVVDLDEFRTGKKRDGFIMSYYSLLLKLGGALASLILGFLMQAGGFDPEAAVQSAQAIGTIESLFTIYPGIFMLLSGLVMLLSPANRKRVDALRAAKEKKQAGEPYDTSDFKELLK